MTQLHIDDTFASTTTLGIKRVPPASTLAGYTVYATLCILFTLLLEAHIGVIKASFVCYTGPIILWRLTYFQAAKSTVRHLSTDSWRQQIQLLPTNGRGYLYHQVVSPLSQALKVHSCGLILVAIGMAGTHRVIVGDSMYSSTIILDFVRRNLRPTTPVACGPLAYIPIIGSTFYTLGYTVSLMYLLILAHLAALVASINIFIISCMGLIFRLFTLVSRISTMMRILHCSLLWSGCIAPTLLVPFACWLMFGRWDYVLIAAAVGQGFAAGVLLWMFSYYSGVSVQLYSFAADD